MRKDLVEKIREYEFNLREKLSDRPSDLIICLKEIAVNLYSLYILEANK